MKKYYLLYEEYLRYLEKHWKEYLLEELDRYEEEEKQRRIK